MSVKTIEIVHEVTAAVHEPSNDTGAADAAHFEHLLAGLSTALIRATAGESDAEIERGLEQVVLALDLDRATVGQIDSNEAMLYATHQWSRPGVTPTPSRLDVTAELPWLTARILSDEVVTLPRR